MRKLLLIPTVAAAMLALAACQSPEADTVEDSAEAEADGIDEMADEAPTEAQEKGLENKADMVEEKGEETADSMDDNRETAPSETRSSDPQNK
jgi:hypothetical protein